jgi:hypothetical protein
LTSALALDSFGFPSPFGFPSGLPFTSPVSYILNNNRHTLYAVKINCKLKTSIEN